MHWSMIETPAARNIAAWRQRWNETQDPRFLPAIKNAVGTLLRRERTDLLDALVSRGVLDGYDIDDNLNEWPIRLSARELKLFGVDSSVRLSQKAKNRQREE
jgi:hypothetical protein